MAIPRIYVRPGLVDPRDPRRVIALDPAAAHHVARVLRLRAGERLVVFDGRGGEFDATLRSVSRTGVGVEVEEHRAVSRESDLAIHLVLGLSRGERMDFALQKTVELGVSEIAPVATERSVVKLDSERSERRLAHWARVVRGACEQSGRTRLPLLHPPRSLPEWLQSPPPAGSRIVLAPGAPPLEIEAPADRAVIVAVGPEGGFSDVEIEHLQAHGFLPAGLGPRILRAETAAAAAVLLAQMRWGDMR